MLHLQSGAELAPLQHRVHPNRQERLRRGSVRARRGHQEIDQLVALPGDHIRQQFAGGGAAGDPQTVTAQRAIDVRRQLAEEAFVIV